MYRIFERDPKLGPPLFRRIDGVWPGRDRARWGEALRVAANRRPGVRTRGSHRTAKRPAQDHSHPRTRRDGHDGRAIGLFGTAQDVTASRRAEDALRQSEQLLRALYDTLPHALGVVELAADGWRLMSFNPGAVRLLGLTETPVAGAALSKLGLGDIRQSFWSGLFDRGIRERATLFVEHTDHERKRDFAITLLPLGPSSALHAAVFRSKTSRNDASRILKSPAAAACARSANWWAASPTSSIIS